MTRLGLRAGSPHTRSLRRSPSIYLDQLSDELVGSRPATI
jgi:hypothetical protein